MALKVADRLSLFRLLGGASSRPPERLAADLSPAARRLLDQAFADLGGAPLVDYHVHLIGLGVNGSGATVHPHFFSWRHPADHVQMRLFASAAACPDLTRFDADYAARLARLARAFGHPLRIHLMALDRHHHADGTADAAASKFYVPNAEVVRLAQEYPDVFVPVMSVHPARADALDELEKWAAAGVRYVKWLPNAQGIDPAEPRYDGFYRLLVQRRLVLLSHTGEEKAVPDAAAQALGNPLRLRRALDLGVTVIMAHVGSLGKSDDLDHPGARTHNLDLCLRLLAETRYRGYLFADISAMTLLNRMPGPLLALLRRPELHPCLVNGSDYPLPALNCAIWTRQAVRHRMITPAERRCLNEVYDFNPLLFDFLLKRTVRDPETGNRLPPELFLAHPNLP